MRPKMHTKPIYSLPWVALAFHGYFKGDLINICTDWKNNAWFHKTKSIMLQVHSLFARYGLSDSLSSWSYNYLLFLTKK